MSEFTSGNLYQKSSELEALLKASKADYYLRELNEKWNVFFLEDDWLKNEESIELLMRLSNTQPILHFEYAEDHGWRYIVFDQGKEIGSFVNNYDRLDALIWMLAEEKYPDVDPNDVLYLGSDSQERYNALKEEAEASMSSETMFDKCNVESFSLFDSDENVMRDLKKLFSYEEYQSKNIQVDVDRFKNLLGLNDLNWMSYRYLEMDEA